MVLPALGELLSLLRTAEGIGDNMLPKAVAKGYTITVPSVGTSFSASTAYQADSRSLACRLADAKSPDTTPWSATVFCPAIPTLLYSTIEQSVG